MKGGGSKVEGGGKNEEGEKPAIVNSKGKVKKTTTKSNKPQPKKDEKKVLFVPK